MANSGDHRAVRLGISAEAASAAFDIASWTLLVTFIVGGAAALVIVFTSIDKERHWDKLQEQSRARIIDLQLEIAKANLKLGRANSDAASANQSTAASRQQTAALEREAADRGKSPAIADDGQADAEKGAGAASLEVEKDKNPRIFSSQQLSRITDRLKSFERTPFDFSLTPDLEAISLMNGIASALTDSGWEWKSLPVLLVNKQTGGPYAGINTVSGVQIQVDERKKHEWEKPALELRDILKATGIDATAEATKAGEVGDDAIHIRIGSPP